MKLAEEKKQGVRGRIN
jgi:cilia- and flagella-associated protein 44